MPAQTHTIRHYAGKAVIYVLATCVCLVPLFVMGFIWRTKWLLRLAVYPLFLLRIAAGVWIGTKVFRFLSALSSKGKSVEAGSENDGEVTDGDIFRFIASVVFGFTFVMFLMFLSSHETASAFQHEFPFVDE